MKALAPTLKNKFLFAISFNIMMAIIYFFIIKTSLKWELIASTNLIIILVFLNWLPKSDKEMDEREIKEKIKTGDFLYSISSLSLGSVFIVHLIWFQEMTIINFMLLTCTPIIIATSIFSYKLKKELAPS
jgi:hypothetical protein